jgi:hypothetical protein
VLDGLGILAAAQGLVALGQGGLLRSCHGC